MAKIQTIKFSGLSASCRAYAVSKSPLCRTQSFTLPLEFKARQKE